MTKHVNWIGVLAAVVATYLLGGLWYGALFAEKWMALKGFTTADITPEAQLWSMGLGVLVQLVVMAGLGFAVRKTGMESWAGGAKVGLFAGVFFAVTTAALNFIYGNEPSGLIPIDFGYLLMIYVVGGALVGGVKLKRKG